MYRQVRTVPLSRRVSPSRNRPRGRGLGLRVLLGIGMAVISIIGFLSSREFNPVTGEDQYVRLTKEQEIAMGLQTAPEVAAEFGGLSQDQQAQQVVDEVGEYLVANSIAADSGYPFEFSVLADDQTVNAFALPGGPIFITEALLSRLESEGQLAGVLGHEIGHVLARHSAERIAQLELQQGLTGALVIATYDPENPSSQQAAMMAALVGQFITMRYGREDELQSDRLGVRILAETGYDPRALIRVMEILEEASGGSSMPEFASTHPNPGNRIREIEAAIQEQFPNGVPEGLTP